MFRMLMNWLGGLKGFGTCPNCNDSWWWKSAGTLHTGLLKQRFTGIEDLVEVWGVDICRACLENPDKLDDVRIKKRMMMQGWRKWIARTMATAVQRYKKEVSCRVRPVSASTHNLRQVS